MCTGRAGSWLRKISDVGKAVWAKSNLIVTLFVAKCPYLPDIQIRREKLWRTTVGFMVGGRSLVEK